MGDIPHGLGTSIRVIGADKTSADRIFDHPTSHSAVLNVNAKAIPKGRIVHMLSAHVTKFGYLSAEGSLSFKSSTADINFSITSLLSAPLELDEEPFFLRPRGSLCIS